MVAPNDYDITSLADLHEQDAVSDILWAQAEKTAGYRTLGNDLVMDLRRVGDVFECDDEGSRHIFKHVEAVYIDLIERGAACYCGAFDIDRSSAEAWQEALDRINELSEYDEGAARFIRRHLLGFVKIKLKLAPTYAQLDALEKLYHASEPETRPFLERYHDDGCCWTIPF